jgi:lipopolysaccharide transport system ATP-binding protein
MWLEASSCSIDFGASWPTRYELEDICEGHNVSVDAPFSIELSHVSKVFPSNGLKLLDLFRSAPVPGFTALNDVSLAVRPGETVGLLGGNGAGKSTLLQVAVGTLRPTSGTAVARGRISALLELGAGFNPQWTGRRNSEFYSIIQGNTESDLPKLIEEIQAFADIGAFFDKPMRTYSSGMFLRVAFAAAVATDPDIVIVDEALAVGDSRFQNKCFNRFRQMQEAGKTILFVTHDPVMVSQFCTRGVVLKQGSVVLDGTPNEAVKTYRRLLYGGPATVPVGSITPRSESRETPDATMSQDSSVSDAFSWPPDPLRRTRRAHYNPHGKSAGSLPGQIVDIALLEASGTEAPLSVQANTRLRVAVQIAALQDFVRPSVGLVIKSKEETIIAGISNTMLGLPDRPIRAGEKLSVYYDIDVTLARGDYFLDVGLAEAAGSEMIVAEWLMSACHVAVENPQSMFGVVDMNVSCIFVVPLSDE